MEFIFEKKMIDGLPRFVFAGYTGMMKRSKMPFDYLNSDGPHIRETTVGDGIAFAEDVCYEENYLYVGDILTPTEKDQLMVVAKMAGMRLYRMRVEAKWTGYIVEEV